MPVSSIQFAQTPWAYVSGLRISNNATTPNTQFDVAAGSTLDSTGKFQLTLSATTTANCAGRGLNGLDTGSLAAATFYAIYLIGDPFTQQATGVIATLASNSAPLLPFGYSAYRLIGYIRTATGAATFLPGYWTGGSTPRRTFAYDAPQATAVTAGAETTYTGVVLTTFVPPVQNTPVSIAYAMTPAAASRTMSLTPFGATGDAFSATSQVTSVVVRGNATVLARLNSAAPTILYKWSAGGGDAVALNVAGYDFIL